MLNGDTSRLLYATLARAGPAVCYTRAGGHIAPAVCYNARAGGVGALYSYSDNSNIIYLLCVAFPAFEKLIQMFFLFSHWLMMNFK